LDNKYFVNFVLPIGAEFVVHLLDKTIARYNPIFSNIDMCLQISRKVNIWSEAVWRHDSKDFLWPKCNFDP